MASFWQNFHHWLHRKLPGWKRPVQPVMKTSPKSKPLRFIDYHMPQYPAMFALRDRISFSVNLSPILMGRDLSSSFDGCRAGLRPSVSTQPTGLTGSASNWALYAAAVNTHTQSSNLHWSTDFCSVDPDSSHAPLTQVLYKNGTIVNVWKGRWILIFRYFHKNSKENHGFSYTKTQWCTHWNPKIEISETFCWLLCILLTKQRRNVSYREGKCDASFGVWAKCDRPLEWRHNERDGVSNHRRLDCLLNRLFRRRSKKTSKLRVTGLCKVTGGFLSQRARKADNISI